MRLAPILLMSLILLAGCGSSDRSTSSEVGVKALALDSNGEGTFQFQKQKVTGAIRFKNFPPKVRQSAEFELRFWNTKTGNSETGPFLAPPFPLNHPDFKLWMNMGHGSTKHFVVQRADRGGNVLYRVSQVFFTMVGAWEIQLKVRNPHGAVVDEAKISYEIH